ncbi:MAG: hypothetical protein QXF87_04815 [Thermofilaceae archaeon]
MSVERGVDRGGVALAGAFMAAIGIVLTAAEAQAGWPVAGPLLYMCGAATVLTMLLSALSWRAAAVTVPAAVGLYAATCIALPLTALQLMLATLTVAAVVVPALLCFFMMKNHYPG